MKTTLSKKAENTNNQKSFFESSAKSDFFAVQPKLNIGQPGDKYEQEADRMAEEVISEKNTTEPFFAGSKNTNFANDFNGVQNFIQRDRDNSVLQAQAEEEEEEMVQPQLEEEEEEMVQPKGSKENIDEINDNLSYTEKNLSSNSGEGFALDSATRTGMEQGFGTDFSNVKIHTNAQAVQMNRELGAQAFTNGSNIYFNEGKYSPETKSGKKLLAHELTHTIQQGAVNKGDTVQRFPFGLSQDIQKLLFRSRNYGPITYTRSEISGSGFDASYFPRSNRLNITVRGKVRFADTVVNGGGTFSSPNHFMNQSAFLPILNNLPANVQSRILPYLQWTDRDKKIHMLRFKQNLEAATSLWQDTGMSFRLNEPGWEDVTATPHVNLDITQGDAVHQTQSVNVLGTSFSFTNPAGSDHLQVEIVKQPTADDVANIQRIITEHNATIGATVTSGMVQGVRSYMHNDPGSRGSAPQGFNNFMSLESDRSDDPSTRIYSSSAHFENNESSLSDETRTHLDSFLNDPNIFLDNSGRDIDVDLNGFASAPGTTAYNRSLVERRLNSVEEYITNKAFSADINTNVFNLDRTNDSDQSAENDLAANPGTHDPAEYRRVDISITREGRGGQNVLAHELGHVFGLGDEYAEVGSGYNRPAGTKATHDQLARDAGVSGGAIVGDDNRLMSTGNEVGAAHYSTFADALNQLTSKRWIIVTS